VVLGCAAGDADGGDACWIGYHDVDVAEVHFEGVAGVFADSEGCRRGFGVKDNVVGVGSAAGYLRRRLKLACSKKRRIWDSGFEI